MMKKERSIFRMILTAMLVVLGLEVLLLLVAFYFSNMGPQMNQNAMDIVEKQVENRSAYLENVMLAKELLEKEQPDYKVRKKEIHDEIEGQAVELLKDMGLADRMGNYPHQLSGGQCQRVAIARALALRPDILCFDEPTSALDPELTGEVLKVIKGLADQKMTMIIVTHEMAFARDVANQVVFMDNGFIVEQGTPDQVFGHTQEERTRQFLSRFNQR